MIKARGKNKKIITEEKEARLVELFRDFQPEILLSDSDKDFAVLFDANTGLMDEMKLLSRISLLLGYERVDLVNLNKDPVAGKSMGQVFDPQAIFFRILTHQEITFRHISYFTRIKSSSLVIAARNIMNIFFLYFFSADDNPFL